MEKELNIAAILKDKPNAKLWSPIVGNCTFKGFSSKNGAIVASFVDKDGELLDWDFNEYGKTFSAPKEAEVCLFPSKSMRDWSRFAWKKGDVLIMDGYRVVFDKWLNDDYTRFNAVHLITSIGGYIDKPLQNRYSPISNFITRNWRKMTDAETKIYMDSLEREFGGKLNRETLEVEANVNVGDVISDDVLYGICTKVDNSKVYCDFGCDSANYNAPITKLCLQKEYINVVMPANKEAWYKEIEKRHHISIDRNTLKVRAEFKDGDIAFADYGNRQDVFIVSGKTNLSEGYNSFIALDLRGLTLDMGCRMSFFKKDLCKLRLATEEEKKQLFSALEKEGKAWDAEKKRIVELKPKIELKPFDKVLIRDFKDQAWQVSLFGYKDANNYYCCNGSCWNQCIPYEGNEHLVGTTKDVEG